MGKFFFLDLPLKWTRVGKNGPIGIEGFGWEWRGDRIMGSMGSHIYYIYIILLLYIILFIYYI